MKGRAFGREVGFLYDGQGAFSADRAAVAPIPAATLRLLVLVPGGELTYTAVPVGSGRRLGIDADLDGALDGDEVDGGSDPRDPSDTP